MSSSDRTKTVGPLPDNAPHDESSLCRLYMELTAANESQARIVFMFVSRADMFNTSRHD